MLRELPLRKQGRSQAVCKCAARGGNMKRLFIFLRIFLFNPNMKRLLELREKWSSMYEKMQMPGLAKIISFIYIQLSGASLAFFTVPSVIPCLHPEMANVVEDGSSHHPHSSALTGEEGADGFQLAALLHLGSGICSGKGLFTSRA